jgi:SAM-dependent methyltransferase
MPETSIDFAYPWWLNYGHLFVALLAAAAFAVARLRRWSRWIVVVFGVFVVWASGSAAITWSFGADRVPSLPTQNFLRAGAGRVLDIGAGTGRSTIMVLGERPNATVVALDLFGDSFEHHFGPGGRPEDRLMANLGAAGVASRASIQAGDMRSLPLPDASFDAVVSAYAMDHVGGEGARQALAEAHRVLEPGGEFLLMLVANDLWMKFAFGPVLSHGGTRGADWWRGQATAAGFEIVEEGTRPGTLYFLLGKGRSRT